MLLNALALNATTLGIPCIYYGTEQGFDGAGDNDRFIRESMFGGTFGRFTRATDTSSAKTHQCTENSQTSWLSGKRK